VREVCCELEHRDILVWIDEKDIRFGDEYWWVIEAALKSCDIHLIFLGHHKVGRVQRREIGVILDLNRCIIPIILPGGSFEDLPLLLRGTTHAVDFSCGVTSEKLGRLAQDARRGPPRVMKENGAANYAARGEVGERVPIRDQVVAPAQPWYHGMETPGLADFYFAQGRYADAERLYRATLEVYCSQGRYVEAEALYRPLLAIKEKHPDLVNVLEDYAALLWRLRRDDDADAIEARVREIRQSGRRSGGCG
jgi:hypothetical protein